MYIKKQELEESYKFISDELDTIKQELYLCSHKELSKKEVLLKRKIAKYENLLRAVDLAKLKILDAVKKN